MRVCFGCKKELSLENFTKDNTRGGHQRECKECCRERKFKWHQTPSGQRSSANTKLKRRFGITIDDYERMYAEQGGECLCCGASESVLGHRLAVDHCHTTGKVRGLLCKGCNVALGHAKENPDILRSLAKYAEERCKL